MKNFRNFQNQKIITKENEIAHGDYEIDNSVTIRVSNGYLNDVPNPDGNILPAIELHDGSHIEHWKNGLLHCQDAPAVIDTVDKYEEWWLDGKLIKTRITIEKEN